MNANRSGTQWLLLFIFLFTARVGPAVASADPAQNGNASANPAPGATTGSGVQQSPRSDGAGQPNAASRDAGPAAAPPPDGPKNTEPTIEQLEQEINDLEQRVLAAESKINAPPPVPRVIEPVNAPPIVTADKTGFTIKSSDGNFLIKFGADLQMDNRTFLGTGATGLTDTAVLRRVRPVLSGTVFRYIDYFFRPDFGMGEALIYDAYVELKYFQYFKVRAGKFKPPVGLERLQSDDDTTFVERGLPTLLAPSRDIGFQISGDLANRRATYAVGVFNGVPDNSLSDSATSDHRDYAARLFLSPFQPDNSFLSGLGFGMGSSFGSVDGEALPSYKTFGQNSFLPFASGVTEAGHRARLTPGAYYYVGPLGLFLEDGLTEEGLQKGAVRRSIAFRAWQAAASYILTGEKKTFASPTPKKNFDPSNHGWGAVEVAARVGEFSAEQGLYNYGFASYTTSPRLAHEVAGGVNWYLNDLFRISLDYGHTTFEGGATVAAGLNRPAENALIFRFQIDFVRASQSWAYRPN
ncbi:MAG: OprO/OprP family phosphate-selective porin [Bryobacteraceae bacterium]